MKQSLRYFFAFLLWNVAISVVLIFAIRPGATITETMIGIVISLSLAYLILRIYLLRQGRSGEEERADILRLNPLRGDALRWTLGAVPVLLIFSWSLGELYVRIVPVPPDSLDPFGDLFGTPGGRLMLAIFALALAPLLEEFFFRGLIQSTLERALGAAGGLLAAAALFALVHFLPWIFPLHFVLGAAFGFAVLATRSIWSGVLLHAANNAVAFLAQGLVTEELEVQPTIWQAGLDLDTGYAILAFISSSAVAVWIGRRLWEAGREARLRLS